MLRKKRRNGMNITDRTVKDSVSMTDTEDMAMVYREENCYLHNSISMLQMSICAEMLAEH
jgi:hypothetical protein